jgi:hypothetical protein
MAANVRAAVTGLLDAYREADGYSVDDYHAEPVQHPMAEGKYLLACSEMHACGLMPDRELKSRAEESLQRLAAHQVVTPAGTGWGLGFAWAGEPADATYAITTAIVLQGLQTLHQRTPQLLPPGWSDILHGAVAYLLDLRLVSVGKQTLVTYSPTKQDLTYNVTAMWCGALAQAVGPGHGHRDHVRNVALSLLGARVSGAGWPYGPTSGRVDLVHTCYTYAGLMAALPDRIDELDLWLLEDLLRFRGTGGWLDRYDVYPLEQLLDGSARSIRRTAKIAGEHALIGFDVPARAWSLGELLVLAAQASRRPAAGGYWRALLPVFARETVEGWLPEERARHAMHLAHGLACVVAERRSRV